MDDDNNEEPTRPSFSLDYCSTTSTTKKVMYHILLFLLWTFGYIRIGSWCFDTGGDIGMAVFVFISTVGILLLLDILILCIRPLIRLLTRTRFNKAYHDDDLAESVVGHVVRSRLINHPHNNSNCFLTMIDYTVLLQRLEIMVVTEDEMEIGSLVELRVLRWHPRSGIYFEEWNKDLRRAKCFSLIWLFLGTPFLVYYILILCNFKNLGGFPWGMLAWHVVYIVPPAILYGQRQSRHMKKLIVDRASIKEEEEMAMSEQATSRDTEILDLTS